MSKVYVVTNVEMGWDNVCGVFSSLDTLSEYLAPEEEWDEEGIKETSPFYNASLEKLKTLISRCLVIHAVYLD